MFYNIAGIFVVTFLIFDQGFSVPIENHNDENGNIRLGIVISPLMDRKMMREIGIYWNITNLEEGDKLMVYDGEPEVNGIEAIYSFEPKNTQGFEKTRIQAQFVPTMELTFVEQCLKYHVSWVRNGIIKKTKCLATHPNWMKERKSTLGSKRLNEIFIPGTHDSGAYHKNEKAELENLVDKYIITQDEDVLSQLIYGVRYLDIRVGRYPGNDDLWWINHGYFSVHPLRLVIDDVKTFLNNTEEIVIFDVQEFPVGFGRDNSRIHDDFVAYLKEQFAGYFLPKTTKGWAMSLDEIWASGKRLIIGYDNSHIWPKHNITWQPVTHRWPNVKTLDDLYKKIDRYENEDDPVESVGLENRPPSSVMAQLTPEALDAVLDLLGGLKKMAELVNMNVTDSYNSLSQCSGNIVSMDYIKSSGIIETALERNDKKSSFC